MRQWRKSHQRWLSSAAILTFALLAPTRAAALGQGNSDFGHSHKPSDPGNSDFGHSKASDPDNSDFGQSPSIPTPEPATLTLLALGGGAAALARYRKSRRKI